MDGNGALFGTLSGNTREVLHKFTVDLPKKHGNGAFSVIEREMIYAFSAAYSEILSLNKLRNTFFKKERCISVDVKSLCFPV